MRSIPTITDMHQNIMIILSVVYQLLCIVIVTNWFNRIINPLNQIRLLSLCSFASKLIHYGAKSQYQVSNSLHCMKPALGLTATSITLKSQGLRIPWMSSGPLWIEHFATIWRHPMAASGWSIELCTSAVSAADRTSQQVTEVEL
jgi:hypothetical protein